MTNRSENATLNAYESLANLFALCDTSNPEMVTLDTELYLHAKHLIEEYDDYIGSIRLSDER